MEHGGCGKDTFVEFVSEYADVTNFSSVAKVKEVASVVGWDGGKTDKDRKFLSDLKRLTTEYNDMSFISITNSVNEFKASEKDFLFLHIREPEEISRAAKQFSAKALLIKRPSLQAITTNYSDANIENYNYDFVVVNDGTLEDFKIKAQDFVKKLRYT